MRWVAVVLVLVMMGGGCTSPATSTSTSTTTEAADPGIILTLEDYRFVPATLSIVESQSVEVRNQGRLAHTWTVVAVPLSAESDIADASVLAEGRVEVGQSVSVDISELTPGSYQVICAIPGHFTLGMVGQLEIGDP